MPNPPRTRMAFRTKFDHLMIMARPSQKYAEIRGFSPRSSPHRVNARDRYRGAMAAQDVEPRGMKVAFLVMAAVVVILALLLAINIARHALSPQATTKVHVSVDHVEVVDPSHVAITATLRSASSSPATVSCLVGVARPAMPLAFPEHITEQLSPGVARQITVERALIKPVADTVRTSDVALTCT